jgi:DNA-binding Lrp family transcriptional regulator
VSSPWGPPLSNHHLHYHYSKALIKHSIPLLPEVVQLYHVAGPIDFMVHVWLRDSQHLRDLTMNSFTSREEVEHIETELIFEHTGSIDRPIFYNI